MEDPEKSPKKKARTNGFRSNSGSAAGAKRKDLRDFFGKEQSPAASSSTESSSSSSSSPSSSSNLTADLGSAQATKDALRELFEKAVADRKEKETHILAQLEKLHFARGVMASAAGFRYQFLYLLAELLAALERKEEWLGCEEAVEDVDLWDKDGTKARFVQLKYQSSSLGLDDEFEKTFLTAYDLYKSSELANLKLQVEYRSSGSFTQHLDAWANECKKQRPNFSTIVEKLKSWSKLPCPPQPAYDWSKVGLHRPATPEPAGPTPAAAVTSAAERAKEGKWKEIAALIYNGKYEPFLSQFQIGAAEDWNTLQARAIRHCTALMEAKCPEGDKKKIEGLALLFYTSAFALVAGASEKVREQNATRPPRSQQSREGVNGRIVSTAQLEAFLETFLKEYGSHLKEPIEAFREHLRNELEAADEFTKCSGSFDFSQETAYSKFIFAAQDLQNELKDVPEPYRAFHLSGIISQCLHRKRGIPSLNPKKRRANKEADNVDPDGNEADESRANEVENEDEAHEGENEVEEENMANAGANMIEAKLNEGAIVIEDEVEAEANEGAHQDEDEDEDASDLDLLSILPRCIEHLRKKAKDQHEFDVAAWLADQK